MHVSCGALPRIHCLLQLLSKAQLGLCRLLLKSKRFGFWLRGPPCNACVRQLDKPNNISQLFCSHERSHDMTN